MRADRLLALLILLQTRGRLTARRLADELEVSERTIYRDIQALSTAGVPVYAERGPGGGCELLESYRTNLTGLNEDEVRALFMLSVPAPLAELGVSRELKTALLKLSAALPPSRQQEEERVRKRIHLDSVPWFPDEEPLPYLQAIHQAVWQDLRLYLTYRPRFGTEVERLVDPYGLVAKTNIWYLVAARGGRLRVYRLGRVLGARLSGERFERPADFDLAAFWNQWCAGLERDRPAFPVDVRVSPALARELPHYFGDRIRERIDRAGPPDEAGWIDLTLSFESLEAARDRLLDFGRAVEVLAPLALRKSIADFAIQIAALYER
jgi:predicted DNA-binding transcriptional regulator YafY